MAIDRREDEGFQEYTDRKDHELRDRMWKTFADGSWVEEVVTKELAGMMADAVDAYILNEVVKRLDTES